jgi:hypothetical protein
MKSRGELVFVDLRLCYEKPGIWGRDTYRRTVRKCHEIENLIPQTFPKIGKSKIWASFRKKLIEFLHEFIVFLSNVQMPLSLYR